MANPASRPGTSLIGVEAGVAKFLALDFEAVNALGSAYLTGSIDFAKVRAEIFGGVIFEYPKIGFDNWRLKVGNDDPNLTDDERREQNLLQNGGRVGGQVLVELIGAHYEVGYDSPPIPIFDRELPLELTGRLDAAVHAFARIYAEGAVGSRNVLQVGGKAFAGASTTLSGQAELASMIGLEGSLTGWTGVGAEFTVGVVADFEEGEYGYTNSAGVAVGVGASYDYGLSVSPGAIYDSTELSGRLPQILGQFVDRVATAGEDVAQGEISPGEFVGEVASASGQVVGGVARSIDESLPE